MPYSSVTLSTSRPFVLRPQLIIFLSWGIDDDDIKDLMIEKKNRQKVFRKLVHFERKSQQFLPPYCVLSALSKKIMENLQFRNIWTNFFFLSFIEH